MLNQDDLRAGILIGSVIVASWALDVAPVSAEEPADKAVVTDSTKKDCRYEGIGEKSSANGGSSGAELLPENDVFRPLWADPKQPQFFASLQATKVRAPQKSYFNMGSVGFGENFGLSRKAQWLRRMAGRRSRRRLCPIRHGCRIYRPRQADYVIGIPVSFRSGLFSTRVRLFHQSSHLGDEFLLQQSGESLGRTSVSRFSKRFCLSMHLAGGDACTPAAHMPCTYHRLGSIGIRCTGGLELRGPTFTAPLLAKPLPGHAASRRSLERTFRSSKS